MAQHYVIRRNLERVAGRAASREDRYRVLAAAVAERNRYLAEHPRARPGVAAARIGKLAEKLRIASRVVFSEGDREVRLEKREQEVAEIARLDDCHALETDLGREVADKDLVHRRYKDLAPVETAFRDRGMAAPVSKSCVKHYVVTMPEAVRNIYDSLEAARRLRAAGLPEPHAEAVVREQVHLMEHNLATKADIAAIQADIAAIQADIEKLRLETKADIEKQRLDTQADITAVHADIEKLRLETKADIATVRGKIEAVHADLEKLRLETKADIEKHQLETRADIEKLRLETKADIATIRGNIEAAKADIVKWMVGANIGGVALIVAALKLL